MSTEYRTVARSDIQEHPRNPRADALAGVDDLAASITEQGILQPLVVAPHPKGVRKKKGTTWVLIAGHRRLAAAKRADLAEVPVIIRTDLDTLSAQLEAMLVENGQRTDLDVIEEANAIQGLLDLDVSQADIARKIGRSQRFVTDRNRIASLPAAAKDSLLSHQITIEQALQLAEFDDDPDTQVNLVSELGGHNFAWRLEHARGARSRSQQRTKERAAYEAAGITVVQDDYDPDDPDDPDDSPLSALEELFDDLSAPWVAVVAEHEGVPAEQAEDILAPAHVESWHRATCEHHVVVDGSPFFPACTKAEVHEDLLGERRVPRSAGPTAEEVAEREKAAQLRNDLVTARDVRTKHLAGVIAGDCSQVAREMVAQQFLGTVERLKPNSGYGSGADMRTWSFSLLGLDPETPFSDAWAAAQRAAREWPIERLIAADDLLGRFWSDYHLRNDFQWRGSIVYLSELQDRWGYQWSDVERGLLPEALAGGGTDD